MLVYRKNFLKEKQLGIVPKDLYNKAKQQSLIALKWLAYKKIDISNKNIIYEYSIPNTHFYVDGYNLQTNTVFEFLGCFYHGIKCFPYRNKIINNSDDTIQLRYENTMLRLDHLASSIEL